MKAAALALFLCGGISAAEPKPVTLDSVMRGIEKLDESLKGLKADFTQLVKWEAAGTTQTVEGTLEFKKPNFLRLEQRLPEAQIVVSDGTWLWIHRKSTNQVIKAKYEEWKKSEPMAQGLLDFGSYSGLIKSYDVSLSTKAGTSLILKPKQKGQDFALTLTLSATDYFPMETELKAGGAAVRSTFKNIRYNPTTPDERFRFTPPAGADVFEKK